MQAKFGDVVIDRTYDEKGTLGIVIGGAYLPILLSHDNGITKDELGCIHSTWKGLEVIGHIDFEEVWKKAEELWQNDSVR